MADLFVMIGSLLRSYLAEVAEQLFSLQGVNCCTFMADWLIRLGLPDVMPDHRGDCASPQQFRRLVMAEGGMIAACHRRLSAAGLRVTDSRRAGDVAVVMVPYARVGRQLLYRATGAIARSETNFVLFGLRGLIDTRRMRAAKVWTVNA